MFYQSIMKLFWQLNWKPKLFLFVLSLGGEVSVDQTQVVEKAHKELLEIARRSNPSVLRQRDYDGISKSFLFDRSIFTEKPL